MSTTKRRHKAIARRTWVHDMRNRWDVRQAISVTYCTCGAVLWLGRNATAEDREGYDTDVAGHDYCEESA